MLIGACYERVNTHRKRLGRPLHLCYKLQISETQKVMISTVVLYYMNQGDKEPEMIGLNRYYETMAFHAIANGPYIDADVGRQVYFDSPWSIDSLHNSVDNDANDMHEAVGGGADRKNS